MKELNFENQNQKWRSENLSKDYLWNKRATLCLCEKITIENELKQKNKKKKSKPNRISSLWQIENESKKTRNK